MIKLLTTLVIAVAPIGLAPNVSADPAPFPYCAYDPTGNAGQWSDPCLPVGLQPGRPVGGNPGITTYNPPAMQWGPATNPDTGLTQNPYVAGGGQW